jgi:hypothetical protein
VLAASSFDKGGFEVALVCLVVLWIVAAIGFWHESRAGRRRGRLMRWRIALIGMPLWIGFVALRLALHA